MVKYLLWAFLLCGGQMLWGQTSHDLFPKKPEPAVYVHDYSNWLTPAQKETLELKLRHYWDSTSTQIVVMIRPDIGQYDKSTYAFELGNRWGIGRKDVSNGLVMLIKTEQPGRGAFIATGYGLEGALPDITAGRIIRNVMIPYFQEGQNYEGIDAGVDEIIRNLSGEYARSADGSDDLAGDTVLMLMIFFALLFLYVWWRIRRGTLYSHDGRQDRSLDDRTRRVRRGGRGGWGGGGWGGGGGFGGGGFGGGSFGGGGFGGGGAGGNW